MDEPEHGPETQAAVVLVLQRLGRADEANAALDRFLAPLDLADEVLSPTARNRFGEALRMAGRWAEAERWYESALRAAETTSDRYEQARALDGLAYARWQAREPDAARRHGQAAQAHYTELGVPEARQHRPWQR